MKNLSPLAICGLTAALFLPCPAFASETLHGRVVGISDGDTLTLLDSHNRQHRIRLAEIDAPEKKQAFGQRSRESLSDLAFGKTAVADCPSQDRYGRSVCVVSVDGVNVNLAQVQRGMAWAYTKYARDARIFAAEKDARSSRRGLWADPSPTEPWLYRRKSP